MSQGLREALLGRLDVLALIGARVVLKQRGREWVGLCPFHDDHSPSFSVNPAKGEAGLWFCPVCQAGGDVFDFVQRTRGLPLGAAGFREALEQLALENGLEPAAFARSPEQQRAREGQRELNARALAFFQAQLRSFAGTPAREYLRSRGITPETASAFGLGYAPKEWSALTDELLSSGARAADCVELGLLLPKKSGGGHVDAFRHRLVFPIFDAQGRPIGFAGRALAAEDTPKYLNTKNTPLYDKGTVLFNLARWRASQPSAASRQPPAGEPDAGQRTAATAVPVLVEGYLDVLALSQAALGEAVACCGTAFSEAQWGALSRYGASQLICALDQDAAGRQATERLARWALSRGTPALYVAAWPSGKDPDEALRAEGGREALAAALAQPLPAEEWLAALDWDAGA